MSTVPRHRYSVEEYLAYEQRREDKSEFFAGDIFGMAGASPNHVLISANIISGLHVRLKMRPCRVFGSDLRLNVPATGLYTFPTRRSSAAN